MHRVLRGLAGLLALTGDVAFAAANNPIWRDETIGSYRMFFNAVTHYDQL